MFLLGHQNNCEAQGKGRSKGRPRKVTQRSFIDGGWWVVIGALAKRALRARARYLKENLARRNRDLQPGGTEIESLEEKSDSL